MTSRQMSHCPIAESCGCSLVIKNCARMYKAMKLIPVDAKMTVIIKSRSLVEKTHNQGEYKVASSKTETTM